MPLYFPAEFEKLLAAALPEDEIAPLLDSLQWPVHSSVRLNSKKAKGLKPELTGSGVPHYADGYILKERPEFVADPAFHAGCYYVQEASSMVIGSLVSRLLENTEAHAKVLDLCAAPGGKSTHIASALRQNDILVANETIQSRTPILRENLCKWGSGNHIITKADAAQFGTVNSIFDIIVADLPCSGEGLFRKDPESIKQWSEENVNLCSSRQTRICHDVWPALKPGGYFIYSTCTLNKKENEDNVNELLKTLDAEIPELDFPKEWNLFSIAKGCYRLLPHRTPGEGFFFAILQKKESDSHPKKSKKQFHKSEYRICDVPIHFRNKYTVYEKNGDVFALNSEDAEDIFSLLETLPRIYEPGTYIGKLLKKKEQVIFKPDTCLSLMSDFDHKHYPKLELNDTEIITWLQRGSMPNSNTLSGIHEVFWNDISFGFANGINHQWNNLWPMEWRIRKEGLSTKTILDL